MATETKESLHTEIARAQLSRTSAGFFLLELVLVSWLFGRVTSSWGAGGVVFVVGFALLTVRQVRLFFAVAVSFAWAAVAFLLGLHLWHRGGWGLMAGLVVLILAGLLHFQAMQQMFVVFRRD